MNPSKFWRRYSSYARKKEHRGRWDAAAGRRGKKERWGAYTEWFARLQADMATTGRPRFYPLTDDLERREFLTIDHIWFESDLVYPEQEDTRQSPTALPAVVIEHENYGGGCPWYSLWKLASVRATDLKVLLNWPDDRQESVETLQEGLQRYPELIQDDPASYLVMIGDEDSSEAWDVDQYTIPRERPSLRQLPS